ncbi:MAG: type II toxin-antitoxin system HicA family toxin [Armatimonadetes bacterium]|nr:type II toxin-antitoxin system HicA family toxin [Armatimonadota bacterium]
MRLPRDLSGEGLAQALSKLGYRADHQTGSHLRLTTSSEGEHHVTVPRHGFLRIGTLSAILADVALHFGMDREELLQRLGL